MGKFPLAVVVLALFLGVDAGKCRHNGGYQEMRGREGFIAQRGCRGLDAQIQEEYWTTIGYDGILRDGRTTDDFLTFSDNNGHSMSNSFVGYWEGPEAMAEITRSKYGESRHYEAFGHVFIKPDGRVCGWFVGMEREVVEVCGGFRVLSRSRRNPHEPIPFEWVQGEQYRNRDVLGFHHHKIAKYALSGDEVFFGDADIKSKRFHGVSPASETFVQVDTPEDFHRKVWLLRKKTSMPPADIRPPVNIEVPKRPQDLTDYIDPHHQERIRNMRIYPYYDQYGRQSGQTSDAVRPAYDSYGRQIPFSQYQSNEYLQPQNQYQNPSYTYTSEIEPPRDHPGYEQWLRNEYRRRGIVPRGEENDQRNYAHNQVNYENGNGYQVGNGVSFEDSGIGSNARGAESEKAFQQEGSNGGQTEFSVNPGPRVGQSEQETFNLQNTNSNPYNVVSGHQEPHHVRLVRVRPQTVIRDKKGNFYEQREENGKIVFYRTDDNSAHPKQINISEVEPRIAEILENRRQEENLRGIIGHQNDYLPPRSAAEEARQG